MNKILLVIQREYISRVKKKSFIIMTILTPFLFGALMFLPSYFAAKGGGEKVVQVVDDSGLFTDKFESKGNITYQYLNTSIDEAKKNIPSEKKYGILYIPKLAIDDPQGVTFFSESNPSFSFINSIENKLESEIRNLKLKKSGIDQETLDHLKTSLKISSINLTEEGEKESSSGIASAVGGLSAVLLYFFMFLYGAQVMRGVMEEKTSRVVEIIVSSLKPFQLMMGKIIGVALVGLTQFILWVVLSIGVATGVATFFASDAKDMAMVENAMNESIKDEAVKAEVMNSNPMEKLNEVMDAINIPELLITFLFYFLGGYFMYAALFATVGAVIDHESDAQQFMLPIMIPLIFSMVMITAIINDPHGPLAFWLSMFPLTSPVIMMIRVPFDVPVWQLLLSMSLLVGGFVGATWLEGRIYRIGILTHGSKVSYKIIAKWLFMKN